MRQQTLEKHERDHALWKKVEEILNYRLDIYRRQNDAQLDERQTERLRGRIAELKDLLTLGREDATD